jgi:hypothetical protein
VDGDASDTYWHTSEKIAIETRAEQRSPSKAEAWHCNELSMCPTGRGSHSCPLVKSSAVLKQYKTQPDLGISAADLAGALGGRPILFVGDSVAQQSYETAVQALGRVGYVKVNATQVKLCGIDCFVDSTVLCHPSHNQNVVIKFMRSDFSIFPVNCEKQCGAADLNHWLLDEGVIVFNAGLHYSLPRDLQQREHVQRECRKVMSAGLSQLLAWRAQKPVDRILIFRGTTPQHFDTDDGKWETMEDGKEHSHHCKQLQSAVADQELDACFFEAAKTAGVSTDGTGECASPMAYYASIHQAWGMRADVHPGLAGGRRGLPDCTHLCSIAPLWDVLWERIYLALLHNQLFCSSQYD